MKKNEMIHKVTDKSNLVDVGDYMKIVQFKERICGASGLLVAGTLLLIFGLSGTMAGPEDSILMMVFGASFLFLSLIVFLYCYEEEPTDSWRDAVRADSEKDESVE